MSLGLSLGLTLAYRPLGFSLSASLVTTAGGTTITVTGPAVTDATVTVDGASRTPTPISDTSFSFVTPAHAAGVVNVVVTTADAAAHTLPLVYQAPVVLTSLTPNPVDITGGDVVTVTGTGMANATGVTVGGTSVAITPIDATHFSYVQPPKVAGTYDVIAQSALGNSNTLTIEAAVPTVDGPDVIFGDDLAVYLANTTNSSAPYTWVNNAGTGDAVLNLFDSGVWTDSTTPSGARAVHTPDEYSGLSAPLTLALASPSTTALVSFLVEVPDNIVDGSQPFQLYLDNGRTTGESQWFQLVLWTNGPDDPRVATFASDDATAGYWYAGDAVITPGWRHVSVVMTADGATLFVDGINVATAGGTYFLPDFASFAVLQCNAQVSISAPGVDVASVVVAAKSSGTFTAGQLAALDAYQASLLVAP